MNTIAQKREILKKVAQEKEVIDHFLEVFCTGGELPIDSVHYSELRQLEEFAGFTLDLSLAREGLEESLRVLSIMLKKLPPEPAVTFKIDGEYPKIRRQYKKDSVLDYLRKNSKARVRPAKDLGSLWLCETFEIITLNWYSAAPFCRNKAVSVCITLPARCASLKEFNTMAAGPYKEMNTCLLGLTHSRKEEEQLAAISEYMTHV